MRKFVVISLGIVSAIMLSLVWAADQQVGVSETSNGSLRVSELDWDFGYAPKNTTVTHRYVLTNAGNKPLKIINVKPACGCTSAPLKKNDLQPGESTDLNVTFSTKSYSGKVMKTVNINTDDSANPVTMLKFSTDVGSAVPTLIFEPQDGYVLNFDTVMVGKKASLKLKLTNNDIQPINLKLIEVPPGLVDARLKKEKLNIGDASELTVNLVNKDNSEGFFNKTVTMQVDGHVDYRVSLPVMGTLVNGNKKN